MIRNLTETCASMLRELHHSFRSIWAALWDRENWGYIIANVAIAAAVFGIFMSLPTR